MCLLCLRHSVLGAGFTCDKACYQKLLALVANFCEARLPEPTDKSGYWTSRGQLFAGKISMAGMLVVVQNPMYPFPKLKLPTYLVGEQSKAVQRLRMFSIEAALRAYRSFRKRFNFQPFCAANICKPLFDSRMQR